MKEISSLKLNKKAEMEMWQIVLIILSVLLLLFMIVWFGQLGGDLKGLLGKLGEIF
ncbi:hypothetical protein J4479_00085 [Candidatus Woesearchaeota archaeon]|nr:hypothetical protein [Candidatus Woesearchaeota archaeon]